MNPFTLKAVSDKISIKAFLDFPAQLYQNDPSWSRPLDSDIEKIFDPKQNKKFRQGDAIRWILYNEQDKSISRIAVFYTKKKEGKSEQPTSGIGFFDCINDQDAADIMFNAAKVWLGNNGMDAMDGPINFGS